MFGRLTGYLNIKATYTLSFVNVLLNNDFMPHRPKLHWLISGLLN
jgi:hypothetical protein